MSTAIKFGTSGWRAIVADEFTVANIRLAVGGIAEYVKTMPAPHRVLVGRRRRGLGNHNRRDSCRSQNPGRLRHKALAEEARIAAN